MNIDIDTKCLPHIACPYCGYEFTNSWELHDWVDGKEFEVDCRECNMRFPCVIHFIAEYSTNMMPYDDSEGEEA